MPRLLLVDDNPSIHKIAETLLATTHIELVCADSAAAALEKVNKGEHFDVALVDTSMAGMDGWGLLAKLRELPETARMPIAMMAGVLDTVDPERIQAAPIQGFLKKPVELRDLGDRIMRLMETPVPLPEPPAPPPPVPEPPAPPPLPEASFAPPPVPRVASPFATLPAVRVENLPEFRRSAGALPEAQEDLLELTEEDLFPEPVPEALEAAPPEESLDLEELDLDSLRNLPLVPAESLPSTPLPAFPPLDQPSEPTPPASMIHEAELDAVDTLDRLPAVPETAREVVPGLGPEIAEVDLPDLGPAQEELLEISSLSNLPELEEAAPFLPVTAEEIPLAQLLEGAKEEVASFTPPLPPLEESLDWSDDSESMLAAVESPAPASQQAVLTSAVLHEEDLDFLDVPVPEAPPESPAAMPTLQLDLEEELPALTSSGEKLEAPAFVPPVEAVPAPVSTEAIVASALLESAQAEPLPAAAAVVPPVPEGVLPGSAKDLLDAMMADPALMDALAKAVVARLGDQTLREIAWEVMPELAERLPRN